MQYSGACDDLGEVPGLPYSVGQHLACRSVGVAWLYLPVFACCLFRVYRRSWLSA